MLRGEAVVETGSSSEAEACVIALSVAELPADPAARFARLFAVRARWELPELEPYLTDLQVYLFTSLSGHRNGMGLPSQCNAARAGTLPSRPQVHPPFVPENLE